MSKPAKKRPTASAPATVPTTKYHRDTVLAILSRRGPMRVIALLQSPTGATIEAMMKATGWQPHSVRGFLAGVVRKRLKLKLGSKKVDGNRVYQIASGDGGSGANLGGERRLHTQIHRDTRRRDGQVRQDLI
jgi:Protein of unknown function (DUF3489)